MSWLDDFWKFVWLRPGLDASGAEWRACLGEERWSLLRGQLFTGHGITPVYRRTSDNRQLNVVVSKGVRRLVCETTGSVEAADIQEEDVQRYRLDPTALRDMIAEALDVVPEPGFVRGVPHAFSLGDWQPLDAVTIPVFLMLPPTTKLLGSEIQRLLLEVAGGFVLLVPQRPRLDAWVRDQLDRRQAAVIPLPEVVAWNGEQFCAAPGWNRHREAYCTKHHADRMVPAPPPYEFRKTGDYWTVRFDGEFTTIKDAVGPSYIAQLLARPHHKIFAPDLLEAVTGQVGIGKVGSAGEQADKQSLDEVKQKYLDAQAELEEAERNNDLAAQERLQRELDGLTDYLKTVKGFNGRTREASDDADKIRRAMTQAIGRVQDSLGAEGKLPAAAQHLRNAIKTGLFMSYEPEEELHWSL